MKTMRGLLLALGLLSTAVFGADLAVRGERVYSVSGPMIEDGVVIIRDGKIAQIGPAADIAIPAGMTVHEAAVVTPGLVDARSVVGLAGYLNQSHDQDQLERSAPIQPELRALDAYNPREPLVDWVRSFGVTTIHTGHGPGEVVSGQTLIAKTRGASVDEAVMQPVAALAATLGEGALVEADGRKSPGTRAKAVSLLRAELVKAQAYRDKRRSATSDDSDKAPDRDLRLEALAQVLDGEIPLMVTAHRHHDILTALRIQREFDIPLILDGAAEAYLVLDEISAAGVPVFLHAGMMRAYGERENLSFTTAAKLHQAGIPFAIRGGYESYVPKTRVVLWEAAVAVPYGLSWDDALAAVTLAPARILGISDRVGSLEVGKDGDLALYDGDPFEYTSHCIGTIIEGERVSDVVR